jgi:hypothetical protein
MKNYLLICVFILILSNQIIAQWESLGLGFNREGRSIFYDSTLAKIYVGGWFEYADSILVNRISVWDGLHWDSLGRGAPGGTACYAITKYQGKIFATGGFYSHIFNCLASWNGSSWDTVSERVNDVVLDFCQYNNELYIGGAFTNVGNSGARYIAKYDGNSFATFPFPSDNGSSVNAIEFYDGNMYVGGNFYDTISGVNDLEVWDGISFHSFGGSGPGFGSDIITSFALFNNELYIAGGFSIANGAAGDNIMRWDGTQFHDVGGGLNGGVFKMHEFNGSIYVCGTFSMAGNVPINNYMARWDGFQWHSICSNNFNNLVQDLLVVNNDLYATGGFTMIDSLVVNHIAKLSNVLSVPEVALNNNITVRPNPASNFISIEATEKIKSLKIISSIGISVKNYRALNKQCIIDISELSNGIYFFKFELENGIAIKKLIKE